MLMEQALERFHSVQLLTGKACLTILFTIAMTLRLDITSVECKHGSVRRLQRSRATTHSADLSHVSADFVLQSVRGLVPASHASPVHAGSSHRAQGRRKRRGGGGVARCVLSELLKDQHRLRPDQRMPKAQLFRAAHARMRKLREEKGPEWDRVMLKAKAGTKAHRAGGASFGKRRAGVVPVPAKLKKVRAAFLPSSEIAATTGGGDVSGSHLREIELH